MIVYRYRVFPKKLHGVCHAINFELFSLRLQCLLKNVQQRLLLTA